MKLRISLSMKCDEMKGVIDLPRDDPAFVLEALHEIIKQFARISNVSVLDVLNDINAMDQGKVK